MVDLNRALEGAIEAGDYESAYAIEQELAKGKSWTQKLGEAWRGDAAETLPNVNEAGFDSFRTGVASMFGSDEDYANALARGGYQITQDANGNPVAVDPETGQRAYVNQPGMDLEDVTRFAGKALSFFPAAKLTSGIASLGKRAAATAATSGATDAAMQATASTAGGDTNVDVGQSLVAAGAGMAGEFGGAAMSRLYQIYKQTKSIPTVREAAQKMGITLSDDQIRAIARDYVETGSMNPAIARNEFGLKTTRGQRSGDWEQLKNEERLRQTTGGAVFREADDHNQSVIENELRRYTGSDTPDGAASRAGASLSDQASALKGEVDRAYKAVGDLRVDAGSAKELPQRFGRALRESSTVVTDDLRATKNAIKIVKDSISKMEQSNTTAFSLKAIDEQRKRLNNLFGQAANPADRRALNILKKEYDSWADDAVDQALISGDDAALDQLKQARALRAEYGRKYQDPKEIAKVVEMYGELAPQEIANHLLGASQFGKAGAARIIRQYKQAGGDVEPLREIMFQRLVQQTPDRLKGKQAIINGLREAVKGRGESVFKELYSPSELSRLARFTAALDEITPKGDFAKSSGTSERLMRYMDDLTRGMPFTKGFKAVGDIISSRQVFSGAPVVAPRSIPAAFASIQTTRP